jgi:hypothetical protein
MGLDIFFYKEIYIGANYDSRKVTGTIDLKINGKPVKVDFNKISSIDESIVTFSTWMAMGILEYIRDPGGDTNYIEHDIIKELCSLCEQIYTERNTQLAIEELWCDGMKEYDEMEWNDYFNLMKEFVDIFKPIIEDPLFEEWSFSYHASY